MVVCSSVVSGRERSIRQYLWLHLGYMCMLNLVCSLLSYSTIHIYPPVFRRIDAFQCEFGYMIGYMQARRRTNAQAIAWAFGVGMP
jgi:hypothetical protein